MKKRKELDLYKRIEASRIAYDFLVLQHATLKCILERKYDELINVTIYDKFIAQHLKRRHSQYTIVALTRSCAVLVNQELLQAFMVRKNNWLKKQKLDLKNKQEMQAKRLLKMQKPTALAIKEQVSVEVDEKLRKVASESTSKIPSAAKSKSNKRKTGLAQMITKSSKETKLQSETASEVFYEEEEGEKADYTEIFSILATFIMFSQKFVKQILSYINRKKTCTYNFYSSASSTKFQCW